MYMQLNLTNEKKLLGLSIACDMGRPLVIVLIIIRFFHFFLVERPIGIVLIIIIIFFLLPPRVFLLSAGHFATCRFDIWYMTSVAVLGFETDPFVAYYFSLRSYLPSFVLTCYRYSSVTVKDSDIKPCAYYSIYKYDVLSYSVEGLR